MREGGEGDRREGRGQCKYLDFCEYYLASFDSHVEW